MSKPFDDILKNYDPAILQRWLEKNGFWNPARYSAQLQEIIKQYGFDMAQIHTIRRFLKQNHQPYGAWVTAAALKAAQPELAPRKQSLPTRTARWPISIGSQSAVRKLEAFVDARGMEWTEFAIKAGTTDRTLRKFRKTGRVKRAIFDDIAKAMGMTRQELLKG